jgi:hypothetical protein
MRRWQIAGCKIGDIFPSIASEESEKMRTLHWLFITPRSLMEQWRMQVVWFVSGLLLLLSGCLSYSNMTVTKGKPLNQSGINQIVVGRTTRSDVFKLMGAPHSIFQGQVEFKRSEFLSDYSWSYFDSENRFLTSLGDKHYAMLYRFGRSSGTSVGIAPLVVTYRNTDVAIQSDELLLFFNKQTDVIENVAYRGETGARETMVESAPPATSLQVAKLEEPAQKGIGGIVPASIAGMYRSSWAVVIGINRYTRAPRLNYAVNDADIIVATLKQIGFPADKIVTLVDREATKQRIEQLLYGTLRETSPDDRVLVFFAGHGVTFSLPRGGEEGYLLPVDGDPDNLALTAIAMEDVRKISRRIPAKHILFLVDACFSGFAITRDAPTKTPDVAYLEAMTREPAVQIITAGRKGEQVLEDEGHGLFTRRVIQGLTGLADMDQNGIITAQELATWLETRVIRDSDNRQHPQYSRLDGEGQFVFVVQQKAETPATAAQKGTPQ